MYIKNELDYTRCLTLTPALGMSFLFHKQFIFVIYYRPSSLRRLCSHRCLYVYMAGGCLPHCMLEYTTSPDQWQTHRPQTRGRHPQPPDRPSPGHTPRADTPPVYAGVWSTSGRYASNWNTFLLLICFFKVSTLCTCNRRLQSRIVQIMQHIIQKKKVYFLPPVLSLIPAGFVKKVKAHSYQMNAKKIKEKVKRSKI